jgi:hypothetical protein
MSPTKVVEHYTEEPTYYEEVVQEPVSGVYCGECKLNHPDMKHITIEQLKREDLESLQNLQRANEFVSHTSNSRLVRGGNAYTTSVGHGSVGRNYYEERDLPTTIHRETRVIT